MCKVALKEDLFDVQVSSSSGVGLHTVLLLSSHMLLYILVHSASMQTSHLPSASVKISYLEKMFLGYVKVGIME